MLAKGTRVELHPATDAWMMGDRYGEIVGLGKTHYYASHHTGIVQVKARPYRVKMDKSGFVRRLHPDDVTAI